jgi:hypothetical protein
MHRSTCTAYRSTGTASGSLLALPLDHRLRRIVFCLVEMTGERPLMLKVVEAGLVHASRKLAGIGGEAFPIAAPVPGEDDVEGEKSFCPARRDQTR